MTHSGEESCAPAPEGGPVQALPSPILPANPLQTPLLIFGDCPPEEFGLYQEYFDITYRSGPVLDRYGRRIRFHADSCEHICFSKDRHAASPGAARNTWRPDRAMRIPWIMVALTHGTSCLKLNKEKGKENYLVAMQVIVAAAMERNYFQVVVKPRSDGVEAEFKTAYKLSLEEWTEARKLKSVRIGGGRPSGGGRY